MDNKRRYPLFRAQLPSALIAGAFLASLLFDAHWTVKLGIVLFAYVWLAVARKVAIPRADFAVMAAGAGCILLLRFGSLSALGQRRVNGVVMVIVAGSLLVTAWQLIAVVTSANRELRNIRRDLASLKRP